MQKSRLAGIVEAEEQDLGLLLPQSEGGEHAVEPVEQEHRPLAFSRSIPTNPATLGTRQGAGQPDRRLGGRRSRSIGGPLGRRR